MKHGVGRWIQILETGLLPGAQQERARAAFTCCLARLALPACKNVVRLEVAGMAVQACSHRPS